MSFNPTTEHVVLGAKEADEAAAYRREIEMKFGPVNVPEIHAYETTADYLADTDAVVNGLRDLGWTVEPFVNRTMYDPRFPQAPAQAPGYELHIGELGHSIKAPFYQVNKDGGEIDKANGKFENLNTLKLSLVYARRAQQVEKALAERLELKQRERERLARESAEAVAEAQRQAPETIRGEVDELKNEVKNLRETNEKILRILEAGTNG